MNKRINRRTFLKLSGIYLAGGILAGCDLSDNGPVVVETPPIASPTITEAEKGQLLSLPEIQPGVAVVGDRLFNGGM